MSRLIYILQDLTITVASELPSTEVDLVEDKDEHHVVNRQSFVDEQEWHLYVHTECDKKELVLDQADNSVKRSALSVKCRAARRPGYFVWNIFMITVSQNIGVGYFLYNTSGPINMDWSLTYMLMYILEKRCRGLTVAEL